MSSYNSELIDRKQIQWKQSPIIPGPPFLALGYFTGYPKVSAVQCLPVLMPESPERVKEKVIFLPFSFIPTEKT